VRCQLAAGTQETQQKTSHFIQQKAVDAWDLYLPVEAQAIDRIATTSPNWVTWPPDAAIEHRGGE